MLSASENLPLVSIVIAAYNARKDIRRCLLSIQKQTYPRNLTEVILVDGGSSDGTVEIAKSFAVKLIQNPDRIAEFAKSKGIQYSRGKYIVILDTDNEIVQSDWLEKNIAVLERDSSLLGMDTQFLVHVGDFLVNRYCALLTTEDPLVRYLATVAENSFERKMDGYSVHVVKPGRFPVFGSNGFIWRKSILEDVGNYVPRFDEAEFCIKAVESGFNRIGFVKEVGIYHHHLENIAQFIGKRIRRGNEFMSRKSMCLETKKSKPGVWLDKYSKWEFLKAVFLCLSIIYPTYECMKGYMKDRDVAWLLHPFLSFVTVAVYGFSAISFMAWKKCNYVVKLGFKSKE